MKKYYFVILIILINFDIFANEGIRQYMLLNNMNYPYNVNVNINKVEFSGWILNTNDNHLQKILNNYKEYILIAFFERLNSISNPKYFSELKNIPIVTAFSIDTLHLDKQASGKISIFMGIRFYLDKDPMDIRFYLDNDPERYVRYNEDYKFWEYFDIVEYSGNDFRYLGFVYRLYKIPICF